MSVVFFHIPRTGGSTIWHSLIQAATKRGVWIADLYYDSMQQYGEAHHAYDVLEKLGGLRVPRSSPNLLYHHHTRQNLTAILPPSENQYVTAVRDPVERFVSEIFLLKEGLINGKNHPHEAEKFGGKYFMDGWALEYYYEPEFYAAAANESLPIDELMLLAVERKVHENYYFNYFYSLLFGSTKEWASTYSGDPALIVKPLAREVKEKFAYIGIFPFMQRSVREISTLGGFQDFSSDALKHIENGSKKMPLARATRERLRDYFDLDYQFLDLIVNQ